MAQSIQEALAQIAKDNDLTTVSIAYRANSPKEYQWDVTFHRDGFSRKGNTCTSEWGATPADALVAALAALKADRCPYSLNDAEFDTKGAF